MGVRAHSVEGLDLYAAARAFAVVINWKRVVAVSDQINSLIACAQDEMNALLLVCSVSASLLSWVQKCVIECSVNSFLKSSLRNFSGVT